MIVENKRIGKALNGIFKDDDRKSLQNDKDDYFDFDKVKTKKDMNNWIERNKAIAAKPASVKKQEKDNYFKKKKERFANDRERLIQNHFQ